ncbi:MAG: type IV secretion system protein, partial [Planctomycetota bacterium]
MAASDNVSDRILNNIDTASLTYINDTFVNLWGAISVSFRNLLVLWIILYGLAIWRGLVKTPVQEFAWTMLKFAVIYGLISTWGLFSGIVVIFITDTPDAMAGVLTGGVDGATASGAIGAVYIDAIAAADNAMSS